MRGTTPDPSISLKVEDKKVDGVCVDGF